jgi:hypothetical protein
MVHAKLRGGGVVDMRIKINYVYRVRAKLIAVAVYWIMWSTGVLEYWADWQLQRINNIICAMGVMPIRQLTRIPKQKPKVNIYLKERVGHSGSSSFPLLHYSNPILFQCDS